MLKLKKLILFIPSEKLRRLPNSCNAQGSSFCEVRCRISSKVVKELERTGNIFEGVRALHGNRYP